MSGTTESWEDRAAAFIEGPLTPDPTPTLVASEIGCYGFCPRAWYLERCAVPAGKEAEARLARGSAKHAAIGRRTDRIRALGMARRWLLVAILLVGLMLFVVQRGSA
jgi:hypothetical protein